MLLKDFERTNGELKTEYDVFDNEGEYIESFIVDYLDPINTNTISKRLIYEDENATIRFVRINKVKNILNVSITAKRRKND